VHGEQAFNSFPAAELSWRFDMPNWCFTSMSVTGPASQVSEFIEFAKSKTDDSILTFRNFVPMPPALEIVSGSDGEMGYAVFHSDTQWQRYLGYPWVQEHNITTLPQLQAYVEKHHPQAKATGKAYADNLTLYGAKNWYDWSIGNWGTKWDACSATLTHVESGHASYSFETAWSPAMPVFLAMSERFPDLKICATFDEEADFYKFEAAWFGGNQVSERNLMHE
jgi:Ferredoxin-like domain in Api92-like protein